MKATDKFEDTLLTLVSKELHAARQAKDVERMGSAVEGLARAIGTAIAIATNGDPIGIDKMIAGVEGYAHQEAVAKAMILRLLPTPTGGE